MTGLTAGGGEPPVAGTDHRGAAAPARRAWTLRARLTLLFALAGVALVLVSSVAAVSFVHLTDTRRVLFSEIDPGSIQSDQLFQAYLDEETGIRGYLLTHNVAFLQPFAQGLVDQRTASAGLRAALAGHPDLLALATSAQDAATRWSQDFALPAVAGGPADVSSTEQQLLGPGKARFDLVRLRFATLGAALSAERSATRAALTDATTQLVVALAAALVLVLLAGIGLARALRSWVTDPLTRLGDSVRLVSAGELAHTIEPDGPPEIADLGSDVEGMRVRIVDELDEVAEARADLAATNLDLLRSNEELEQFAYVASHDLQEPLRKVTSFVQLLQQRYEGQLDERADQYIGFAVDGSRRMQVLINDLLAFSRVGRTTDGFVPVDTAGAAREAVAELADVIREADATVTIAPLPTVAGDPVLLTSLFVNLVGNAVKFRGAVPPVVTVEAAPGPDGGSQFTVTDNGIGIEPRFADRIFVIFQRLHARDAFGGTGIGLALCRKIVEFHGGTIWLDTEFRGGTRVCFTLPTGDEGSTAWHVAAGAARSNS